jgi:UDP-N-acetylglucosamine acyltransferase
MKIHPTAIVEDGAEIGEGARIGPYCCVGPRVKIGAGVVLHAHVTITGATTIGPETVVHPFAALGGPPQHLGYRGEDTALIIGAGNIIREHVTMNIGTVAGRGKTRIGDRGMFMTACHVAHDCIVGDNVIMANNATLGGHVVIEDSAFLGGLSAIHQYCRVGAYAFIGGCAAVPTDVIPYGSAVGNHAMLAGLNIVGLKRRGVSREAIHDLRAAYKLLFSGGETFQERLADVEKTYGGHPEVARILAFIKSDAPRPLMTPAR